MNPKAPTSARIYALVDSEFPSSYRYIGKTIRTVEKRLYHHMHSYHAKTDRNMHKCRWIDGVHRAGRSVEAVLLEECALDAQDEREIFWITSMREAGHKLTNLSDGGEGGFNPSQEVRDKISKASLGRKLSDEAKEKIRVVALKRDYSGSRNPMFGLKRSDETKRKIAEKNKLWTPTDEQRAKHKKAMEGANTGETNPSAKLTESDVVNIYTRKNNGERTADLAKEYGIHQNYIYRILNGKKWAHLNLRERFVPC